MEYCNDGRKRTPIPSIPREVGAEAAFVEDRKEDRHLQKRTQFWYLHHEQTDALSILVTSVSQRGMRLALSQD